MALPSGLGCTHLLWIIAAAGVGFTTSFVLTDLVHLPIPAYHACYFASVVAFLGLYTSRTRLSLSATVRPRLMLAVILGVVAGAVLAQRVLAEPSSAGRINAPDVIWRGIVYGTLDGAMLSAFPWIVTWRALGGEHATLVKHAALGAVALGGALLITSAYHAGYRDFRGSKLVQANIGNAIATIPTLVAANPVASPIAHAILHVSAVVHNPRSDLFLPPHE